MTFLERHLTESEKRERGRESLLLDRVEFLENCFSCGCGFTSVAFKVFQALQGMPRGLMGLKIDLDFSSPSNNYFSGSTRQSADNTVAT